MGFRGVDAEQADVNVADDDGVAVDYPARLAGDVLGGAHAINGGER